LEKVFDAQGMTKVVVAIFRSHLLARFIVAVIRTVPPRRDNTVGPTLNLDIDAAREGACVAARGTITAALTTRAAT